MSQKIAIFGTSLSGYHIMQPQASHNLRHPYFDSYYIFSLLRKAGLITQEKIDEISPKLVVARRKGIDIVQWLVSLKLPRGSDTQTILEEPDILELIARDKNWGFRRLDPLKLDMDVVTKTIPAGFAKKRLVIPIAWHENTVELACYDPLDPTLLEDLEKATSASKTLVVASKSDIERVISEFFEFKRSVLAAESALYNPDAVDISNLEQFITLASPDAITSEKHIQRAVDHLLQYALSERVSDIHFEPRRNETVVRMRIDGRLNIVYRLPKVVHEAVITRLKALSRLDIAEKRRPQDGRMKIGWKGEEAEIRVSTVPVSFGEKMVLRLQSADILFRNLTELGFADVDLERYKTIISKPYGMILMTGPTGSGKSTTLYSSLRHLSSPEINIVSIEDPVEMVHEEFNQIAVQPAVDVTFSTILRNILRQDPDVIMVGEIRDLETARHSVQAALTGHMVFSTLHTNDAASAITRLKDLGLAPYLIASTLLGVVAQRLVRMICPFCKEELLISTDKLRILGYQGNETHLKIARGKGCARCRNTGYYGRIGIYELLIISDEIRRLIHEDKSEAQIKVSGVREGTTSLSYDGLRKVLQGITTPDEVMQVALI